MPIRWSRLAFACLGSTLSVGLAVGACSSDETTAASSSGRPSSSGSGGSGAAGGESSSGPGTGGSLLDIDGGSGGRVTDPDAACASSSAEATLTIKPIDIVMIIDNSGSMGDDIEAVQSNINGSFASIIGQSGIDYRVILVARHGDFDASDSICVSSPLSSTSCAPIPPQPALNPPIFFQHSTEVASTDSLCKLFDTYSGPDEFGFAPSGWSEWLREDAFKVFVEISDDRVNCDGLYNDGNNEATATATAMQFDQDLLALDPLQFGDASKRNYIWHSIVGMLANTPADAAWLPSDPVVTAKCSSAVNAGIGYQALSILTGGLRFPLCEHASYDAVFQAIAQGIIEGAEIECEFPVPDPPAGETIDPASVKVQYTPGGGGAAQTYDQVAGPGFCVADSFYIENDSIKLCPETCTLVQGDDAAKVLVLFDCKRDPD